MSKNKPQLSFCESPWLSAAAVASRRDRGRAGPDPRRCPARAMYVEDVGTTKASPATTAHAFSAGTGAACLGGPRAPRPRDTASLCKARRADAGPSRAARRCQEHTEDVAVGQRQRAAPVQRQRAALAGQFMRASDMTSAAGAGRSLSGPPCRPSCCAMSAPVAASGDLPRPLHTRTPRAVPRGGGRSRRAYVWV